MAHIGYDGNGLAVGDRVELHPGLDLWMRGARYGTVQSISTTGISRVRIDCTTQVVTLPASRLRVI
jgi:hypothetical protein